MEILGHDDENTQLHYKQFKLANFSKTWRPNTGNENTRLEALQLLDDEMPDSPEEMPGFVCITQLSSW
ncbi:hypothetical protein MWK40_26225 [Escherichia coli]|nr:hypothetical protein [Escherichia coli]